ncbi:DUF1845 family protein [Zooshikella marina]|uniref:AcaB family transcriptional regulator n=1 Tax=Zooshikella ganghwensis TaxID=202772 RepID=UPI001BAE90F6|nr:AcaB family transcriptional regulator [Zooshikella ganghwensis]MBU2707187.1 DUF1845 family protein [Zooshikella ganghwensis]
MKEYYGMSHNGYGESQTFPKTSAAYSTNIKQTEVSNAKQVFGVLSISSTLAMRHLDNHDAFMNGARVLDIKAVAKLIKRMTYRVQLGDQHADKKIKQWDKLIQEQHQHMEQAITQIKIDLSGHLPQCTTAINNKVQYNIHWNDPLVWNLLRMVMLLDHGCMLVNEASRRQLIDSRQQKKWYSELGKPLRKAMRTIAETAMQNKSKSLGILAQVGGTPLVDTALPTHTVSKASEVQYS